MVAQLLLLQTENSKAPIHMYINSPGGVVTSGLAIYDTMQYVKPPIATWCVGQACSAASLLLAAGAKDMRNALPNSRIMVHQPSGGAQVRKKSWGLAELPSATTIFVLVELILPRKVLN